MPVRTRLFNEWKQVGLERLLAGQIQVTTISSRCTMAANVRPDDAPTSGRPPVVGDIRYWPVLPSFCVQYQDITWVSVLIKFSPAEFLMPVEKLPNPSQATGNDGYPQRDKQTVPIARWLVISFFALSGGLLSAIAAFVFVEVFVSAGDFTEMFAVGYACVDLIVGGFIGLFAGIAYTTIFRK